MTTPHKTRIVFLGTPDFAVASLKALVEAGYRIVGVITAPDKPAGRGMHLQQSPVKQYALAQGLHVLQPERLKNPAFLEELRSLNADLQVVVAFRMLPELVWNMPPMGTVNVHGSLLPQYRGAAPINWAIINGETETGITIFKLKHAIDTGDVLLKKSLPIGPAENAGELHDRMMNLGAEALVEAIDGWLTGRLMPQPQAATETENLQAAPKIFAETCRINWQLPAAVIFNQVRGLAPFPGAFTEWEAKKFKIFETKIELAYPAEEPGTFVSDGKTFLKVACSNGYLHIMQCQAEGKKRMDVLAFLRGHRFAAKF